MARAWIELTGRWGPDQATLGAWENWGGGYAYAVSRSLGSGTARLLVTAGPGDPPGPGRYGPAPAGRGVAGLDSGP